jgi:chemotaxis protein MotA
MLIVFGAPSARLYQLSRSQLRQAWQEFHQIFREPKDEAPAYLARIIEFAYRGRREGMLSLEKDLAKISDPFFRRGLQLVIDGHNHQKIQEVLEVELEHLDDNGQVPARVFETAGGYAPTIGILGAVLGLIHVMQNLTDPAKLGVGVAVAFVATVYGVASANLFFLPIGHKLRLRNEKRMLVKEMMLMGIPGLAHGDHPVSSRKNCGLSDGRFPKPYRGKRETCRPSRHEGQPHAISTRRPITPPAARHDRWLVSYADFVTLLLAFFVTMYAITRLDSEKMHLAQESINRALSAPVFVGGFAIDSGL